MSYFRRLLKGVMRKQVGILVFLSIVAVVLVQCDTREISKNEIEDLTGNSVTYALQPASSWNVSGTVVFSEKKDGSTLVNIQLSGLNSSSEHPVHLHMGNIATDGAAVAALLQPLNGKTGESQTVLSHLADESSISFSDIKEWNACIKIHLSAFGEGQDVVLAAGNIGSAVSKDMGGRVAIGVCRSN